MTRRCPWYTRRTGGAGVACELLGERCKVGPGSGLGIRSDRSPKMSDSEQIAQVYHQNFERIAHMLIFGKKMSDSLRKPMSTLPWMKLRVLGGGGSRGVGGDIGRGIGEELAVTLAETLAVTLAETLAET